MLSISLPSNAELNKGINDEATVGRRKLLAQSGCIECISRLSSHSNDRLQGSSHVIAEDISPRRGRAQMIFSLLEKNSLAIYGYNIQNSQNMDKQKIHYCFTLSDVQMEYLRCKKYKIDRMECFMSLASSLPNVKQHLYLSARPNK